MVETQKEEKIIWNKYPGVKPPVGKEILLQGEKVFYDGVRLNFEAKWIRHKYIVFGNYQGEKFGFLSSLGEWLSNVLYWANKPKGVEKW